jgi:hypothetical protein
MCQYDPFQRRQLGDEKALSTLICDRLSFCLNVAFIQAARRFRRPVRDVRRGHPKEAHHW